jgi:hypothetical protein
VSEGEPRRTFLRRASEALIAIAGASVGADALASADAQAQPYYTFCGHTYTTASCPHPTGLPRVDRQGYPLRASDGQPIDDLGRPVNSLGQPIDASGQVLRGPDGQPLPSAPRTRVCLDDVPRRYGLRTYEDGSWYRCCGQHVRKLIDCCAFTAQRINGDAALTGYCYGGRNVFCVFYYDTQVPC